MTTIPRIRMDPLPNPPVAKQMDLRSTTIQPTSSQTQPQPQTTPTSQQRPSRPLSQHYKAEFADLSKIVGSSAILSSANKHQLMRGDESAMTKKIMALHNPDSHDFDVRPLVLITEDILHESMPAFAGIKGEYQPHAEAWDYKGIVELLAYPINRAASEILSKCAAGEDAHSITMALLQSLSNYSWEAKLAISLAALALNYGEFWLVTQLYSTNRLANLVAQLKELPEIMEHHDDLKQKFEAVHELIIAMLEVTHCINDFKELSAQCTGPESPDMIIAADPVPTAVYWTVRSIVACSSLLMNLTAQGHQYVTSSAEAWELSGLAPMLANINAHLKRQISLRFQKLEEKRQKDAFYALVGLFKTPHIDNTKILRALICAKEDQLPLYYGTPRRRASLDILRRKHVLLLVSDLDVSHKELTILHQMHSEASTQPTRPESQYEVVWLPVVDRSTPWTDAKQQQFELIQNSMPWYSVAHPSLIDPAVLRFIKEIWGFTKKPQLVVLDPQGRESNRNALHMMWIWGSLAFPFTRAKEEALWREETWRIELLADSIDQNIFLWTQENRYICLYGGEDMDWIRKFTTTTRSIANAAAIQLEMLYVGKSNPKDRVRRNNSMIQNEKLSLILPDITLIWFFWVRLESMWHSKVQHGMTVENDRILEEIVRMLSYDASERGWAVFCRGSYEMTKGIGETVLQCLMEYDRWKDTVALPNGFVIALSEYLDTVKKSQEHHCVRLILPGQVPQDNVRCVECQSPMEKLTMYRCCKD